MISVSISETLSLPTDVMDKLQEECSFENTPLNIYRPSPDFSYLLRDIIIQWARGKERTHEQDMLAEMKKTNQLLADLALRLSVTPAYQLTPRTEQIQAYPQESHDLEVTEVQSGPEEITKAFDPSDIKARLGGFVKNPTG